MKNERGVILVKDNRDGDTWASMDNIARHVKGNITPETLQSYIEKIKENNTEAKADRLTLDKSEKEELSKLVDSLQIDYLVDKNNGEYILETADGRKFAFTKNKQGKLKYAEIYKSKKVEKVYNKETSKHDRKEVEIERKKAAKLVDGKREILEALSSLTTTMENTPDLPGEKVLFEEPEEIEMPKKKEEASSAEDDEILIQEPEALNISSNKTDKKQGPAPRTTQSY